MRYQFIEAHRQEIKVTLMCRVLTVSTSGYYAWRKRPASQREMANQKLLETIPEAQKASNETYGSPRIYEEIKGDIPCSRNRVARLIEKAQYCRQAEETLQAYNQSECSSSSGP